jgi:hypothetical protein
MSMVFGLDLHRQQITFDGLDVESGEVWKGRVWQPDRERFRRWLERDVADRANGQPVALAVEGCTGWRYVVEEITAAGFEAHLAEPADTQAARGPKRRAKTDRSDAALLRELLQRGDLPESWIPPTAVLEWRERVRLYKSLVDQRSVWTQRIHAELFQHGVSIPEGQIRSATTRTELADHTGLSPAAHQRIRAGYAMIDAADAEADTAQDGHDPIRETAAGVSSAGRHSLRHWRVAVGRDLVRARRLPPLHPFRTGSASQRPRRDRRRVGSSSSSWASVAARTLDVAVGAVRSRAQRVTTRQPRPRLLHAGETTSQRQGRGALGCPPVRPTLLSHLAQPRPRRRLRDAGLSIAGPRRSRSPIRTSRVATAVCSCQARARRLPGRTAI